MGKTYFSRLLCRHGHNERYVRDNRCAVCQRIASRKASRPAAQRKRAKRWRRKNRAKEKARFARWATRRGASAVPSAG